MRLELVDTQQFAILQSQLNEIRQSVLLFLRKLARLSIDDGTTFSAIRTSHKNILQLNTQTSASARYPRSITNTVNRYLSVAHTISAAADDEKRSGQTKTEIVLAFPLTSDDQPLSSTTEMVYAFLPLRSVGLRVGVGHQ